MIGFKPKGSFAEIPEDLLDVPEKPKRKYSNKLKSDIGKRFEDNFDIIFDAYTNPKKMDKLTPTVKRELARWKFARMWISEFEPHNDSQTVAALRTEFAISERQAYTDVANTKRFFASVTKVNQEFDKVIYLESLRKARRKCMELGTVKGLEVASRYDVIIAKVQGYDREHVDLPEPVIVVVEMTNDIGVLGLKPTENAKSLIKGFWKKKEEQQLAESEEVSYEDIMKNPRNESEHQK